MNAVLDAVEASTLYWAALAFFAAYPIVSSVVWVSTGVIYAVRRERAPAQPPALDRYPPVSVLVPAFNEQRGIRETVEACLALDYPDFEVVVVDDGSTDETARAVAEHLRSGRIRLVRKLANEGKAMALNDAIMCLRGELLLIVDADARPDPLALRFLVPHFEWARVAAVTGNPRVVERTTFLAKLQVLEFTSIVSLLRRAQRVWGRILTVSGVVTAFRVSALVDVGLFSPDMATEDIDVTWKLQKRFYDVRYEPNAIVWMRVPTTWESLWRQRRRWALGLAQVLRRHGPEVFGDWRRRRMWPVATEAVLSIVWAYLFVLLSALWTLSLVLGRTPAGANPFPNVWGMTIVTLALLQLLAGVLLDRRYERGVTRDLPVAVAYPLVYWMLMALITVVTTPKAFLGSRRLEPARWHSVRPGPPVPRSGGGAPLRGVADGGDSPVSATGGVARS